MRIAQSLVFAALALAAASCRGDADTGVIDYEPTSFSDILSDDTHYNIWDNHLEQAPDDGCVKLPLKWTGRLSKEFSDLNHMHIEAARELGFEPITSATDIMSLRRPVVKVESCADFFVEPPTHSFPYLVPEAAGLLHEIGQRFNEALRERGGGSYRIKVTSLLRTPATVKKLSRVNRNASGHSSHAYGTTFDISYSKFICDSDDDTLRSFEDMKNLLAEILHDLREEGRCYVKYEVKQSCFHITARPNRPTTD